MPSYFQITVVAIVSATCAWAEVPPAASKAVDVTQFGARPDDDGDDTQAFVAAVDEIQSGSVRRLLIPPGRYHLTAGGNPKSPSVLFPFSKLDGLEIEGTGAELLVSGVTGLFLFDGCRNVSVRGLSFDSPRPAFSVGMVTASAARYFDVAVEPEYPVVGGEAVPAFMDYDPETRLPMPNGLDIYGGVEHTELLGPQMLRVHLSRNLNVPVGHLMVLRHQVYGSQALEFRRCSDVEVNDCTVYTVPGMGLVASVCENVTLKNFNVIKRPGSRRPMSATADGSHFGGCKGTVLLEDCTFEGMGDDGANIKSGLYLSIRKRLDDHTVLAQHNLKMVDLPDPGDTLEMSHVDTLDPFASGKVRQAVLEPGEEHLHRVTFEEALPTDLREGDVLGNASRAPVLRMRRCTVRANRARGVLCQTRDAIIEDCVFQDCTSAGVLVLTEVVHFFESIGTRNVVVRNNLFKNCNYGAAAAEGSLCALAYLKDFAYPSKPGVHRDVVFANNRILGTNESAIFVVGVDGLTIRDNVIEDACRQGSRPFGSSAIRVLDCARVEIAGNTVNPSQQGEHFSKAVMVTPSAP